MKCIQCSTDNNLKERTANMGRCSNCNHPFVFEPTRMKEGKITDVFFAKAISDISVNNTLFFTSRQLLYFLNQKLKRKSTMSMIDRALWYITGAIPAFILSFMFLVSIEILLRISIRNNITNLMLGIFTIYNLIFIWVTLITGASPNTRYQNRQSSATFLIVLGVIILAIGIYLSLQNNSFLGYLVSAVIGLASFWLGVWQNQRIKKIPDYLLISYSALETYLQKWQRINGPINQLLATQRISSSSSNPDPDVTAYSFDRLVVCDSPEIVQILIANNFHFEYNCAILSIDGYPQNIFNTVLTMLKRNQNLTVYAFHSASPRGVQLTYQLTTDATWFRNSNVVIIDLGLQPKQIFNNPRHLFLMRSKNSAQAAQTLPPEVRQQLTKAELAWLDAGNHVELESFSPRRLIQILSRGIATGRAIDTSSSDSGIVIHDVDSFG